MRQTASMARLSVVIPVRNGAKTLSAQLEALATARPPATQFEVIVADNASTDDTVPIAWSYASKLPVRVVDAGLHPGTNVAAQRRGRSGRRGVDTALRRRR